MLSSSLSLSLPASQSFLNASFHRVYSSFWYLTSFSLHGRRVSPLGIILLIKVCSFLSPFRRNLINPSRALGRFSKVSKELLLTLSGIPPFFHKLISSTSLPSSVSCSIFADDLVIWSSSPSVPTAVEATLEALIGLKRGSEYRGLSLSPSKCEASFFSTAPFVSIPF